MYYRYLTLLLLLLPLPLLLPLLPVSVGAVLAVLKAIQMLGECDDQDYNALSPSDSHADAVTQEAVVNPTAANNSISGLNATPNGGGGGGGGLTSTPVSGSTSSTPAPLTAPSGTPGDAASNESRMKDGDISISSLLGNIDDLDDYPFPGGSGNASTPGGGSGGGGGGGSTPGGGRTPGGNGANTPAKTSGNSGCGVPDALAIGAAASSFNGGGPTTPAAAVAPLPPPPPPPPQKSDIGSLTEFAKLVLRTMCGQEWVRERCLQDPESLFQQQHLLDPCLSQSQTRHLLHLICYPGLSRAFFTN